LLSALSTKKTTRDATAQAPVELTAIQDTLKPKLSFGESSLMYTAAVEISPPALMPWRARQTKSATSPNQPHPPPQHSKEGRQPCATVVANMIAMVSCMAIFRPSRSARTPKNAPPSGLKAKVTAKPAHVPRLPPRPSPKKFAVM